MVAQSDVQMDLTAAGTRRAWITLGLLSVLYVFSLIDRQILVLLIGPIKAQFALTDVQIGLLIGTAFAIVYAFLGIPAGRIADRSNRKLLVFAGVVIWCLSTIASGFAASYAALIVLRLGLAAGEAVLTPAAHSMIGDLFPPKKRIFAASIFSAAGLIGSPLAFSGGALLILGVEGAMLGGLDTNLQVWQIVLFAVGLPGLLLGVIFAVVVQEPARTSHNMQAGSVDRTGVVHQLMSRKKLYTGLFLAATLSGGSNYALYFWVTEALHRDFGWTAVKSGSVFGPLTFVAGVSGVLLAPWLSVKLRERGREDAVVLVSLGCILLALVALAVGPTLADPVVRLALIGLGVFGSLGCGMNIVISMQVVAPSRMRATFVALLFMGIALFGAGAVPVIVPMVADSFMGGSLSSALSLVCSTLCALCVVLLWWIRNDFANEARAGFPEIVKP